LTSISGSCSMKKKCPPRWSPRKDTTQCKSSI